jgi:hypothetical protein
MILPPSARNEKLNSDSKGSVIVSSRGIDVVDF